jgi:hypothetical protein
MLLVFFLVDEIKRMKLLSLFFFAEQALGVFARPNVSLHCGIPLPPWCRYPLRSHLIFPY